MLVHLSEDGSRASVVSVPRDSYAEIPAHTDRTTGKHHQAHPVKINAAYAEGGPSLTVRTVEHMTGVKIDHYLEIDFTSFMKTVDAVGGVRICTPRPSQGHATPASIWRRVPTSWTAAEALQYVRSRHIDGAADLGRMQRQQRFLAALINQATGSGVLMNPVKFREVTSTMLKSVRADPGFGTEQMLALNEAMRGFSPSSSEFTSVPLRPKGVAVKGIGSTVKWDPVKSKQLFEALRDDKPLAPVRRAVAQRAEERDGGRGEAGRDPGAGLQRDAHRRAGASGSTTRLRATGFDTTRAPLTSGRSDLRRTVVMYDPRWDRSARSLAAALPGAQLRAVKRQGATMKVMAGADYRKVTPVRAEVTPPPGRFGALTGDQVVCP